jgi:Tol biopolymer transport system component
LVAFTSRASNFPGDEGRHRSSVYVRNLESGVTKRISVRRDGTPAGQSSRPVVSRTGRYVVFQARGRLVPRDTNHELDVYVRDLREHTIRRVSVSTSGRQGDDFSGGPSISADGRFVAFHSHATTLVRGDHNRATDVFVRDLRHGVTRRVSVSSKEVAGNDASGGAISSNGRYVAIVSAASNLVRGDTNGLLDVFVRDLRAGTTRRVSVATDGAQTGGTGDSMDASISGDGRLIAFTSLDRGLAPGDTSNTWDVFVHNRVTGVTKPISEIGGIGQGNSSSPDISADGRYVAFASRGTQLVPDDTNDALDVFVRDRVTGAIVRASLSVTGGEVSDGGGEPVISADGRYVAFGSSAPDLVPGDTNGKADVFLRDLAPPT